MSITPSLSGKYRGRLQKIVLLGYATCIAMGLGVRMFNAHASVESGTDYAVLVRDHGDFVSLSLGVADTSVVIDRTGMQAALSGPATGESAITQALAETDRALRSAVDDITVVTGWRLDEPLSRTRFTAELGRFDDLLTRARADGYEPPDSAQFADVLDHAGYRLDEARSHRSCGPRCVLGRQAAAHVLAIDLVMTAAGITLDTTGAAHLPATGVTAALAVTTVLATTLDLHDAERNAIGRLHNRTIALRAARAAQFIATALATASTQLRQRAETGTAQLSDALRTFTDGLARRNPGLDRSDFDLGAQSAAQPISQHVTR